MILYDLCRDLKYGWWNNWLFKDFKAAGFIACIYKLAGCFCIRNTYSGDTYNRVEVRIEMFKISLAWNREYVFPIW